MGPRHPLEALLSELSTDSASTVLDLGAGSGASALHLQQVLPRAKIYAFECDPSALESCRSALSTTAIQVVPLATGETNGPMDLFQGGTNAVAASSLAPLGRSATRILQVNCTRLDSWCKTHGVTPDLIWCDIEGDPLASLRGLGKLLESVQGIYVPTLYKELYAGQPTFRDQDEFLRKAGFMLITHEQSLPGHWGYAIYVRAANRIHSTPTATDDLPFARGGVGDLLQYIPAAIQAGRIRVFSHYAQAGPFFERLGVSAEHVPFHANTAFLSWTDAGTELERVHFPSIPVPRPAIVLDRPASGTVLGIHPYGSGYSNTFAQRFGAPSKWMSPTFVATLLEHLLRPQDHVILFCSPDEQHHVSTTLGCFADQSTVVACDDLWDSFSMVPLCDAVVGVDSSIKTIASILHIPTVTMVGDFAEPFRDRHFINPYVMAGIMKTVKYKHLGREEAIEAASSLQALLATPRPSLE